jgi:ATP-binding cassette subfamily B protein
MATLTYRDAERPALDSVSLAIAPGETVALVGPSGAGKSTIFNLILRFYDPQSGIVAVDGIPVADVETQALRSRIALVLQDVALFDDTVAENIRYGAPEASDADVARAAKAAQADGFIRAMVQGYATRLGERGVTLSGGQRQRIALARALYGDPFLVVLDEPNANLDSEGEVALQNVLHELKARGAIVVIISHRPAVLDQCDKILVLGNGAQQAFGARDVILRKAPVRLPRPAVVGNVAVLHESREDVGS